MLRCKTNDKNVISSTTLRIVKGGEFLVDGEHKTIFPSHSNFLFLCPKAKKLIFSCFWNFFKSMPGPNDRSTIRKRLPFNTVMFLSYQQWFLYIKLIITIIYTIIFSNVFQTVDCMCNDIHYVLIYSKSLSIS